MKFCVLSSGSRANSTFIEIAGKRFLIDCGLSAREACKRLLSIGISPDTIDAILVTHEHRDHIQGVPIFSKKLRLPVYANKAAAKYLNKIYGIEHFVTGESFEIGEVKISPFSIPHDANDPVAFIIEGEGVKFAHLTDLGKVTPLVKHSISTCNAIVIESNHDPELLMSCQYPWHLKQRIASNQGHLSNQESGDLLSEVMHSSLEYIVLGHISENSNTVQCALDTVSGILKEYDHFKLSAATRYLPTKLFEIGNTRSSIAM